MENDEKINLLFKIQGLQMILIVILIVAFFLNTGFSIGSANEFEEISFEDQKTDINSIANIKDTDVVRGSGNIVLIEYSDLDCPFCKRFHETAKHLVDSGEISWVYRHFPLPSHSSADEGAIISECVRIHEGDDNFLSYIDQSFELNVGTISGYRNLGTAYGLKEHEIDECLEKESEAYAIVQRDIREGSAAGVNGTPGSFLVNLDNKQIVRVPGALPIDLLQKAISLLN